MDPQQFKYVAGEELLKANVIAPSSPDAVKSLQNELTPKVPVTVTVNALVPVLELASKNTLSFCVGALAPPAPPDETAQLAVLV
jgi:hypothetical protein